MSSVPPNMPPGGGAPPPYQPYDPKTQWRVYREQQKAAWRAQREAWKAQHYAMKAGYGGGYGPRVPSVVGPIILVGIGVVALMVVTGHIAAGEFWSWYGRWWPLLLIAAGLAMLGEWAIDLRRETPVRRGGSFVGILILLAILGFGAAGWNNFWGPLRAEMGDHDDSFFNAFGLPEHDNDQQVLSSQVPANATIDIQDPRGDISITAGDGPNLQVQAHEVAYANSDSAAKKIFDAEAAHVTVSGSAVLVRSDSSNSGRLNLTVTVPHSAQVTVNAGKGDVTAAGLGAGISVTAPHGDVHLSTITGPVQAHFSKGEFSAHEITGDITGDGPCNDMTLSEVTGKIGLNCEYFDQLHIEHVNGQVHFRTSKTDVELAALPGDLTLSDNDLHVTEAKGAVRVVTHSRDIELDQIYGDTYVEDRDGNITIVPAGSYNVEAKNESGKGDVEVTLVPNAQANVDGHTKNGDIESDFPLTISGDESKTVDGKIGAGGPKITLSTDVGDLRIKRGSAFPPTPPAPVADAAPTAPPASPNARHLKAPKAPAQPVTQ
jgi:DUF4097 and DUF4098 domain-containing protein YvlB